MYLDATLFEIQRKVSLVPLGVHHSALADTKLAGYNIPKVRYFQSRFLYKVLRVDLAKNY